MIQKISVITFILLMVISFTYCIPKRQYNQKYKEVNDIRVRNMFKSYLELWPKYNNTNKGVYETTTTAQTPTKCNSLKKWQVGRVSRKQYEIINMLWRKAKVFIDSETTTYKPGTKMTTNKKYIISLRRPSLPTPTVSYIEFYYLEENDDKSKKDESDNNRLKYRNDSQKMSYKTASNIKRNVDDSSLWKINDDDSQRSKISQPAFPFFKSAAKLRSDSDLQNLPFQQKKSSINKSKLYPLKKYAINKHDSNLVERLRKYFLGNYISSAHTLEYRTCPFTTTVSTKALTDLNITRGNAGMNLETASRIHDTTEQRTVYDKIRFFEIYDRNTYGDNISYVDSDISGIENKLRPQYFNYSAEKILLKHIDENIGHHDGFHKGKFAKKHISDSDWIDKVNDFNNQTLNSSAATGLVRQGSTQKKLNVSKPYIRKYNVRKVFNTTTWHTFSNLSKVAAWSNYPFAAVYIYEPSQVRCDAAGISPHWLITSASCLSRHRLDDSLSEGRSAFVTYCGPNWRLPERIAYVKYSLTHPNYHPSEERKYMYNIALIKVVSSMSSCSGWSPVTLMSHQYTTSQENSVAEAVGWGLDRHVPRHNEVPLCLLMVYESQIFTDSCPGNYGYSKTKRSNNILNIHYVYCLSLPPYYGEKYDPVHGSLLLAGGKLIALYLQTPPETVQRLFHWQEQNNSPRSRYLATDFYKEERRPWGVQSALYTSIWRLIPWIHNVAQEPELDAFIAEY